MSSLHTVRNFTYSSIYSIDLLKLLNKCYILSSVKQHWDKTGSLMHRRREFGLIVTNTYSNIPVLSTNKRQMAI